MWLLQPRHSLPIFALLSSCLSFSTVSHCQRKRTSLPLSITNQDFEYQEMRAILGVMERDNVPSRYMETEKRNELEGYVRKVILGRESGTKLPTSKTDIVGTVWRLAFSTEAAALGDLPKDATVFIKFVDEERLLYTLEFAKATAGLNRVQAECTWELNEANGSVTFFYDKITADAFGFRNIGIGLFGLLKGRASYVITAYFDGSFWIEGAYKEDGSEYMSVYVRQDESS